MRWKVQGIVPGADKWRGNGVRQDLLDRSCAAKIVYRAQSQSEVDKAWWQKDKVLPISLPTKTNSAIDARI